ncbi:MAG: RNA polymerase sigma factor [Patescibacteria group bacterium]
MVDRPLPPDEELAEAYGKYADAIFRHCYFRVFDRERGKELMQETFMRAWTYVSNSEKRKVQNMRAFLYRIANNLIVDEVRKKKELSLDELQKSGWDPGYDGVTEMQKRVEQNKIFALLHKVPREYREVLVMRYIDGLTPADIAGILGESPNAISVRLHRGIKQLHAMMGRGGK